MDRKAIVGAISEIDVLIEAEREQSKQRIKALRARKAGLRNVLARYDRADEAAAEVLGDRE